MAKLDAAPLPAFCPHMQRARPFRMNVWRLGLLVLACYALVLQNMLAAPVAAGSAANPTFAAALCTDADRAAHQSPGDPSHNGDRCSCTFHCTGASPATPASSAAALLHERTAGESLAIAADQFKSIALRDHASARGPPSDTFAVV